MEVEGDILGGEVLDYLGREAREESALVGMGSEGEGEGDIPRVVSICEDVSRLNSQDMKELEAHAGAPDREGLSLCCHCKGVVVEVRS